jgi:hypothetical protein
MKKYTYLLLIIIIFFNHRSFAQSINNWQVTKESEVYKTRLKIDKKNIPSKYKIYSLDFKSLKSNFKTATINTTGKKTKTPLLMDFPSEDGTMETFSIEKISVLHPDLEAKYPEIQSFYGVSEENPLNKIYISTSPSGFNGLITGEKTIYIDPLERSDTSTYIVYDKKDYIKNPDDVFVCDADMNQFSEAKTNSTAKTTNLVDGKIRTYRLAVACTSEYTAYYGNTVAGAIAFEGLATISKNLVLYSMPNTMKALIEMAQPQETLQICYKKFYRFIGSYLNKQMIWILEN